MGRLAAARLIRQDAEQAIEGTSVLTQLRGKRLLLTGGTGFTGCWLLELIAALNDGEGPACHVWIVARHPEDFAQRVPHLAQRPDFTFIPGDVRTCDLPDAEFDYIIHAAASADPLTLAHEPAEVADSIVIGTRRVLDLAAAQKVERFLFVSSGAVYGVLPQDSVPPQDSPKSGISDARTVYAKAKQTAEALCMAYHQQFGLPILIARPFTFIGPYQRLDAGFAITDFMRDGLQGRPISVHNGSAIRSYAYGADLARWLLVILLQGKPPLAYDVGADEPVSVLALAERVQSQLRAQGIEIAVQTEDKLYPANRYVPDTRQTRDDLNLQIRVPLDEALARTLLWHTIQASSR